MSYADELAEARRLARIATDNFLRVVLLSPPTGGRHRVYLADCQNAVVQIEATSHALSRPGRLMQQVARQTGRIARHASQGVAPRQTATRWAAELAEAQARYAAWIDSQTYDIFA